MLPLEWFLVAPCLLVVPVVLGAVFWLRKRDGVYHRLWPYGIMVSGLLCAVFAYQVWVIPHPSQRTNLPSNPGGFSSGLRTMAGVYLLQTMVVIPGFPVLAGLLFLPPKRLSREKWLLLVIFGLIYLMLLIGYILAKNHTYVADFKQLQQNRLQQVDQFKHLRRP